MHFLKAALLASSLFCVASASTSSCGQQPQKILEVRATPPSGALGATANLLEILDNTYQFVSALVTPARPCSPHSGVVDGYKYEYRTADGQCTKNQRQMVGAAVKNLLGTADKEKIKGTECLTFDHGGYWEGYVKIAKEGEFDAGAYCGPILCPVEDVSDDREL